MLYKLVSPSSQIYRQNSSNAQNELEDKVKCIPYERLMYFRNQNATYHLPQFSRKNNEKLEAESKTLDDGSVTMKVIRKPLGSVYVSEGWINRQSIMTMKADN